MGALCEILWLSWGRLTARFAREDGITVVEYIALAAVVLTMLGVIVLTVQDSTDLIGDSIAKSFDQQIKTWR
jgi:Flp pilus assembly pilin Flp